MGFISLITLAIVPAFILVFLAIVLAALGTSIGLRRFYVRTLIKIFNFGRDRMQSYNEAIHGETGDSSDSDSGGNDDNQQDFQEVRLIERQTKTVTRRLPYQRTLASMESDYKLNDVMYFCKSGIEAIVEDEVTQRFSSTELSSWNLLTRTNNSYEHISWRLTSLWILGGVFRYCILLPVRLCIVTIGITLLIVCSAIVGYIPNHRMKFIANRYFVIMSCRIITRAFGAVIKFHNQENRAKPGGVCVANHTSPIDVVILQNDNCYAMVGQSHGGFLGMMQRALSRAADHIWFERSVSRDRHQVAKALKDHVSDTTKLPILIFPEGTCINNTSVMMFKKGSFEIGGTIYPVAIKYDPMFADCFWNSSKNSMLGHLALLLTSWAIVADVWYLPPEHQMEGETAIQYANRVKAIIAQQGGLVDLEWDGGLKREKPKDSLRELQQDMYVNKQLKTD